jgi:Zn-dependent oligopeptidase
MKKNEIEVAMRKIKSSDARKKLALAKENVAAETNTELLKKIVDMRTEISHMLGYKTFSELALEDLMSARPQVVEDFLDDLYSKIHDKGQAEH